MVAIQHCNSMATTTRTISPITAKELIVLQDFVTIPTYLVEESKDKPYSKIEAYIDILNMADESGGEFETTRRTLERRWGWSGRRVNSFLLELEERTIIEPRTNQKRTKIKPINTGFYDSKRTKNEPRMNQKRTKEKDELQTETSQKQSIESAEENSKRKVYYPNDEKLNQAFLDFMKMRKSIKKPMTDRAIAMAMNRLKKLAGNDNDLAIRILEQSIFHSWQDVYELKEDNNKQSFGKGGIDWSKV